MDQGGGYKVEMKQISVLIVGIPISKKCLSRSSPYEMRQDIMLHECHRSLPFCLLLLLGVPMGMHEPALHVRYDKIVSLGWIDARGRLLSKTMPKS